MRTDDFLTSLIRYGISHGLIEACDSTFILNQLLDALPLHAYTSSDGMDMSLEEILKGLLDDAVQRGVCPDDVTSRDLLDTRLMGILTPRPHEVQRRFADLYAQSPKGRLEADRRVKGARLTGCP